MQLKAAAGHAPRPRRVVVASDKFKGSLSSDGVGEAVRRGLLSVRPDVEVDVVPVADGGDGTLAAAVAAGYELVPVTAAGPTGEPVATAYARQGDRAVVELAHTSGLALLPGGRPAPWTATTRGTGEVLAAALDAGCRDICLGVGGSASTDGGAGLLLGLGAGLVGADGAPVPDPGARPDRVAALDLRTLHPGLSEARLVLACDVDNPLLGPRGAAAVYGPQKGLRPDDLPVVERALEAWADVVDAATGTDHRATPGAGAAGGVGFAVLAALGAEVRSGVEVVLELVGIDERLRGAPLVVTGEGALDVQTLAGKAPAGVAARARAAGCDVVAVCGARQLDEAGLRSMGVGAAYALLDIESDLARCLAEPEALLEELGRTIARAHL
ncbi:glycerate kinase [Phycicoccus sp. DTK01]|uniref:glycerate kinase n=1 Tax=Phycicoccus sp. DTK01 TaxID=2785745 RepID=UPI001A8D72AC|nr:glycerate kinase [Phycicoccus sp. DTK01]GIL36693.1 glycerate kinase [Phycicoccus sp. DTK01]